MKFKTGKFYYIKFYDHFQGGGAEEEIICEVIGKVDREDKLNVRIAYWVSNSSIGDKETEESNSDFMKILKSTIIKKRLINIGD
jgi:hypothetical protein